MTDFVHRHLTSGQLTRAGAEWGRRLEDTAHAARAVEIATLRERVDKTGNGVEVSFVSRIDAHTRLLRLWTLIERRTGPIDARLLRMMFVDGSSADQIARQQGRPQHPHYYRLRIIDALNLLGGTG